MNAQRPYIADGRECVPGRKIKCDGRRSDTLIMPSSRGRLRWSVDHEAAPCVTRCDEHELLKIVSGS
jgi:hypothetical protein